jgi:hypothetical protein
MNNTKTIFIAAPENKNNKRNKKNNTSKNILVETEKEEVVEEVEEVVEEVVEVVEEVEVVEVVEVVEENTSKKMFILTNNETSSVKKIKKKEKERKLRVETNTWGLINEDLLFETQLELLKQINDIVNNNNNNKKIFNKHQQLIVSHIKSKISSYKHQDILKKKLNEADFVSFNDVITLLIDSNMKCYYCACETYLLYEIVREMKQWSLDRINNDIGHNNHNLVICCLECNLKRRRTNKDAFFFTKNLKITKEHYNTNNDEIENKLE